MKRKIFAFILCGTLLAACAQNPAEDTSSPLSSPESEASQSLAAPTSEQTSSSPKTTPESETSASVTEQPEPGIAASLPKMDGSTSAAPLEAGLKSHVLGITYSRARELVEHTTTHKSFERLINGEVDMIFSVPISAEQEESAKAKGLTLTQVPAAKEGFVFVVNVNNPVESLTSEQLRGIYSGKITNWSEVGGKDEPIIAYQRNKDSGSQNYMTEFMGENTLIAPEPKYIEYGMGGIMDAVATYDNAENAIGYSVYSYAAQMYANANKVKFISVDGVKPTKATMADGSYPLSSCTYMICTDKSAEKAKPFMDWVASDEGQTAVLKSGYLPVNGMALPENLMPYEAVGTGRKNDDPQRPLKYQYVSLYKNNGFVYDLTDKRFKFTCFNDEELQNELNQKLKEICDRLAPYSCDKYIKLDENDPFGADSSKRAWRGSGGMVMEAAISNGYLFVALGYPAYDIAHYAGYAIYDSYDYLETFAYDLVERREITQLSDLFYEGTDFVPLLNNALGENISDCYFNSCDDEQKADFSGLLGSSPKYTILYSQLTLGVWFEPKNPYFYSSPVIHADCTGELEKMCAVFEYRDITALLNDSVDAVYIYGGDLPEYDIGFVSENGSYLTYYTGSRIHTDEEIAAENERILKAQRSAIKYVYDFYDLDPSVEYSLRFFGSFDSDGPYYELYTDPSAPDFWIYIDTQTSEAISPETLLCENWREYAPEEKRNKLRFAFVASVENQLVTVCYTYFDEDISAWMADSFYIPKDKLNPRYFG